MTAWRISPPEGSQWRAVLFRAAIPPLNYAVNSLVACLAWCMGCRVEPEETRGWHIIAPTAPAWRNRLVWRVLVPLNDALNSVPVMVAWLLGAKVTRL